MGNNHPDAKLFPHATGAAEQMVKAHQKEEPLKLYSGWVYTQSPGYSKWLSNQVLSLRPARPPCPP
jgi:hypothetical protein